MSEKSPELRLEGRALTSADFRATQASPGTLLIEPERSGLLPAAIIRIPAPSPLADAPQEAVIAWADQWLAGVYPVRPLLLLAGPDRDSAADVLTAFIGRHGQGLHLNVAAQAPAGLTEAVALVPETATATPVGNLVKWLQRLRVPAWIRCEDPLHAEVAATAARGYLSANLLLPPGHEVGPEIARLAAGPCPPSGFESFEFITVRHVVRPEGDFRLALDPAASMHRQPLGTVVATATHEQWVIEEEGDRVLTVNQDPATGETAALIVRAHLPHARLAFDVPAE